jgi:hypothetical protein
MPNRLHNLDGLMEQRFEFHGYHDSGKFMHISHT